MKSEGPLKVVGGRKSQKDVGRWKNRNFLERRLFFSDCFFKDVGSSDESRRQAEISKKSSVGGNI